MLLVVCNKINQKRWPQKKTNLFKFINEKQNTYIILYNMILNTTIHQK